MLLDHVSVLGVHLESWDVLLDHVSVLGVHLESWDVLSLAGQPLFFFCGGGGGKK